MEQIVTRFSKNGSKEVRASLATYRRRYVVDLRIYYRPLDGSAPRPTRKGITLSVKQLPELKQAVLEMERALARLEGAA